jgi:peroxiredoxin
MRPKLASTIHRLLQLPRLLAVVFVTAALAPAQAAHEVPDFNLLDFLGQNYELHRAEGRVVVLFFTGTGCPIARKSAPKLRELHDRFGKDGVTVWVVDSYADDKRNEFYKEMRELELYRFACLRDTRQSVALSFGVERTAEVVAIDTSKWRVIYQGAIDDQYTEGAERPEPQNKFLEKALTEFLAGKPVAEAKTKAHGCRFAYAEVGEGDAAPSYAAKVAPILKQHCVECHREGAIAPWAMDNYAHVKNNALTMEEVLLARRMPPYDADPDYGHFSNSARLSREETQTLIRWVQAGSPRGTGADPLEEPLPPLPDWPIGKPDLVLRLPEVQHVPATGVLDYRHIKIPNPLTNEVWIAGMAIKPGNRKVVHHAILYGRWPGSEDDGSGSGVFLAGWAPGSPPTHYGEGCGKRLPAGAVLTLELHYTTCGIEQTDQTEIGINLWSGPQARVVETRRAAEWNINLPPGSDEVRHTAMYGFKRPATIYGLAPHMHVRGKFMKYELLLPDGNKETLLNVPRYDFNWQFGYALAKPRHVPAGAWLLVTGAYDNSTGNPSNPDPKARVRAGAQSWDEMFIGFFDAADDPRPDKAPSGERAEIRSSAGDSRAAGGP